VGNVDRRTGNVLGMEDMLGHEIQDDPGLKIGNVDQWMESILEACFWGSFVILAGMPLGTVVLLLYPDCTVHLVLYSR